MIASTMICVKTKLSKAWSEVWPHSTSSCPMEFGACLGDPGRHLVDMIGGNHHTLFKASLSAPSALGRATMA